GNVTGPVVLPGFSPLETGEMLAPFLPYKHVAVMEWVQQVRNGSTLDAEVRIKINQNNGAPDFPPAADQMVFLSVAVWDAGLARFVKSVSVTSPHPNRFDTVNADEEVRTYTGDPGGPWIVSPLTDVNGETSVTFSQPDLSAGQAVVVSVMGILVEGTPPPGHTGGTVYSGISLFQMTPLLTEVTQELRLDF
ncbi:MAG: hypothetical protein ACI80N_002780, partial [Gammaproteobacteria bacterium]